MDSTPGDMAIVLSFPVWLLCDLCDVSVDDLSMITANPLSGHMGLNF